MGTQDQVKPVADEQTPFRRYLEARLLGKVRYQDIGAVKRKRSNQEGQISARQPLIGTGTDSPGPTADFSRSQSPQGTAKRAIAKL